MVLEFGVRDPVGKHCLERIILPFALFLVLDFIFEGVDDIGQLRFRKVALENHGKGEQCGIFVGGAYDGELFGSLEFRGVDKEVLEDFLVCLDLGLAHAHALVHHKVFGTEEFQMGQEVHVDGLHLGQVRYGAERYGGNASLARNLVAVVAFGHEVHELRLQLEVGEFELSVVGGNFRGESGALGAQVATVLQFEDAHRSTLDERALLRDAINVDIVLGHNHVFRVNFLGRGTLVIGGTCRRRTLGFTVPFGTRRLVAFTGRSVGLYGVVGLEHAADREADAFGVVGVDGPELVEVIIGGHPHVLERILGVDPPVAIVVEFLGVLFLVIIVKATGHGAEAVLVGSLGSAAAGNPFLGILQDVRGVLVGVNNLEQVFPVFRGRNAGTLGAHALLNCGTQVQATVNLAVPLVVVEAAGIVLRIVLQVLLEPAAGLAVDLGVVDAHDVVDVLVAGIREGLGAGRGVEVRDGILPILFGLLHGILLVLDSLFVPVDQFLVVFINNRACGKGYGSGTAGNEQFLKNLHLALHYISKKTET